MKVDNDSLHLRRDTKLVKNLIKSFARDAVESLDQVHKDSPGAQTVLSSLLECQFQREDSVPAASARHETVLLL